MVSPAKKPEHCKQPQQSQAQSQYKETTTTKNSKLQQQVANCIGWLGAWFVALYVVAAGRSLGRSFYLSFVSSRLVWSREVFGGCLFVIRFGAFGSQVQKLFQILKFKSNAIVVAAAMQCYGCSAT